MKLLSPGVGWVLAADRVLWTSDNGARWTDITPPSVSNILDTYFIDNQHGWTVSRLRTPDSTKRQFLISSTTDAGRHWSSSLFDAGPLTDGAILGKSAQLSFVDEQNGWIVIQEATSANFNSGVIIKTGDGGRTWELLNTPPAAGSITLVDRLNGFMAGGPAGDGLWRTEDGGQSWTDIKDTLNAMQAGCRNVFRAPMFSARLGGTLALTSICPDGIHLRVFSSSDLGHSWQPTSSQIVRQESYSGWITALAGRSLMSFHESPLDGIAIESRIGTAVTHFSPSLRPPGEILAASFADESEGWILSGSGHCSDAAHSCRGRSRLLKTSDGGKTFQEITPSLAHGNPERSLNSEPPVQSSSLSTTPALIGANSQIILGGEGFDTCIAPSTAQMQQQWGQSYNVYGVYIGGDNYTCKAAQGGVLNSNWTTGVTGTGWGLLPIWVGYQASCVQTAGCENGKCTYISADTATAINEGQGAADAAVSAAEAYGMNSTIIYYDLEYYKPGDSACSASVQSFVNSWVAELHSKGFDAGIYGNPYNASDWVSSSIANQPDAAWLAAWNGYDDVANRSNSSVAEPVTYGAFQSWPVNMRAHQYCNSALGGLDSCPILGAPSPITPILSIVGQQGYDDSAVNGPVFATTSASQTLSVALQASPSNGAAPLTSNLTASVTGTATGTVSYTFWWNCNDPGTSVSSVEASCGSIAATCSNSSVGFKCDGTSQTAYTASNAYTSAGTYIAKVIAERGGALPAESRVSITVGAGKSTPMVTISPSPTSITSNQVLTETIAVSATPGNANPTGTVTLKVGSYSSPAATLVNGIASIVIPPGTLAPLSSYQMTASYSGDGSYNSATGTGAVTVNAPSKPVPTMTVTPNLSSITPSQPLTVTVNVNPVDPYAFPTGTVTLAVGSYSSAPGTLANGSVTITIPPGALAVGSYTPGATYSGDSIYATATGTSSGQVTVIAAMRATPTVAVSPQSATINTAQPLGVLVTVLGAPGSPLPTGSVTLTVGSFTSQAVTLANGSATVTVQPGVLAAGTYTPVAAYSGDGNYVGASGSAGSPVTVTAFVETSPTVTVVPSLSSMTTLDPLQLTIGVAATGSNPTPTGTVVVTSNNYSSAAATLTGGSAGITVPAGSLAVGADVVTATYSPDAPSSSIYLGASGSTSVMVTQSSSAPQLATFAVSPATVQSGGWATITITLTAPAPSGGSSISFSSSPLFPISSYTIAGGAANASLQVQAGIVASPTPVTVVASYNNSSLSASVTINPSASSTPELTVSVSGSGTVQSLDGSINCPSSCSAVYSSGASVTLTATPAPGWYTTWTGCDGISPAGCLLTMSQSRTVTATFTQKPTSVLLAQPSSLSFPKTLIGVPSLPYPVTLINNGLAALDPVSVVITGADAGDFTQTNTCLSTGMNAGNSCVVSVRFVPGGTGSRTASLSVSSDNATVSPQVVALDGYGLLTNLIAPTVSVAPSNSPITTAQALTVAISVFSTNGNPTPTGSVTLTSGSYSSGAKALGGGSASIVIPAGSLAIGSDTLAVSYAPDAASSSTYNGASGSNSVVVTAKVTPTVVVSPSSSSITTMQPLVVTVTVSGGSIYGTPTGTVVVTDGTFVSNASNLAGGIATIPVPAGSLAAGISTLTASYTPDSASTPIDNAATGSASVTVTAAPKATPSVTVAPSLSNLSSAQPLTVTIAVAGTGGNPTPSGTVTLTGGGYTSAALTLMGGAAAVVIPPGSLSTGTYSLAASYAPDSGSSSTYNAASGLSPAVTVAPGKSTPTVTVAPSASNITTVQGLLVTLGLSGGTGNPTPTGSVTLVAGTFSRNGILVNGSTAISIPAGAFSVGTNQLTATYAPDPSSSSIYNGAAGSVSITVAQANVNVMVSAGSTSIGSAQPLSVTALVTGGTGTITPTGTVTLSGGGYTSAGGALSSGGYTFAIPANSLNPGTDILTVSYGGDTNYAAGTGTTTVTVSQSVFSLSASQPSSVSAGGSTTSTVTVNTATGYSGMVTITCALTSSPTGATHPPTCSNGSSTVTLSSTATSGTATVTVGTTAPNTAMTVRGQGGIRALAGGGGGAILALLFFLRVPASRRKWLSLISVLVAIVVLGTISACSGPGSNPVTTTTPGTTPGSYTFTVTGAGNPILNPSPTANFTVNVN